MQIYGSQAEIDERNRLRLAEEERARSLLEAQNVATPQIPTDSGGVPFWTSNTSADEFDFLSRQSDAIMDGSYESRRDEFYRPPVPEPPKELGVLGSVWDATGKAMLHGGGRAVEETLQFGYDVLNFFDDSLGIDKMSNDYKVEFDTVKALKPQTAVGGVVSSLSQFVGGFLGAGKVLKVAGVAGKLNKAGKVAKYGLMLAQGAITDAVTQDPHESRLSNLVEAFPALKNPITGYLSAKGDDGALEGRLKNALEGVGMSMAADAVFKGIKAIRASRTVAEAGENASEELVKCAKKAAKEADKAAENLSKNPQFQKMAGEAAHSTPDAARGTAEEAMNRVVADGTQNIDDLLKNITKAAELHGLDISRATGEISDIIEGVLNGSTDPSYVAGTVNDMLERMGIFRHGVRPDINVGEFVENFVRKVGSGAEARAFKSTQSVKNTAYAADEKVKLLFETLEDTGTFKRGATETTTQSMDDVVDRAARNIREMFTDGSVNEDLLKRRLSELADVGEGMAEAVVTMQAAVEEYSGRALSFMQALEGMEPKAARLALERDGMEILRGFMQVAQYQDRLSTGVARGLQAHRWFGKFSAESIPALKQIIDRGAVDECVDSALRNMTPEDLLITMRRLSTVKDAVKMAKLLIPDTRTGKILAMANEYWINSILSGPLTHAVNIASNAFKLGVMMPLEKMMGASWGSLRHGEFDRALWNDGIKAWGALGQIMGDAWRMAKISFDKGHNLLKPNNAVMEYQTKAISSTVAGVAESSSIGKLIDTIGTVANLPTRFLMAGDEFFSQLAYRSHVFTTLYTQGEQQFARGVLKGADKEKAIAQYIEQNFEKYLVNATAADGSVIKGAAGNLKSGLDAAMEATFTKELAAGSFSRKVQEMSMHHPLFRRVAPFVRTPVNILKDAIAHTPGLAHCTQAYREAMELGGREAAIAQGKVLLGSAVWLTAGIAAANGNITGGGPKNAAQRVMLMETGWRPYSLKFGDQYISFARIEPFGSILGMAGDFAEIMSAVREDDTEFFEEAAFGLGGALVFSLFQNLSSKTYAQGIANLMEAMQDKGKALDFMKDHALSHVPALFSQSRKIFDPEIKETQGLIEEFKSRVPGLSESLPTRYSWLTGDPVLMHGGMASGFSPIVSDPAKDNPVAEELVKFPKAVLGPQRDIGGVKLTSEQMSDYEKLHGTVTINGKTLMQALAALVESPEYDRERAVMPNTKDQMDDPRYLMIQDVVSNYRMEARKALFKIYPDLRDVLMSGRTQGALHKAAASTVGLERREKTPEERRRAFYESIMNY